MKSRLAAIDFDQPAEIADDLLVFYHPQTLRAITNLRSYLLERAQSGKLDIVDAWVRMVATNRLTGHSPGFFSVYTLPPNQAVSVASQRRINEKRQQIPPYRRVPDIILKKSRSLLKKLTLQTGISYKAWRPRPSCSPARVKIRRISRLRPFLWSLPPRPSLTSSIIRRIIG